jgi:hypothetical protein
MVLDGSGLFSDVHTFTHSDFHLTTDEAGSEIFSVILVTGSVKIYTTILCVCLCVSTCVCPCSFYMHAFPNWPRAMYFWTVILGGERLSQSHLLQKKNKLYLFGVFQ